MASIAIILPIYKPNFLRQALQSLADQTSHDFMAYLCDDCSPHDLKPIVQEFEGKFPFRYIRYQENLGGKDLIGHWERCIQATQGEEWLWLFSDDDVMDLDCVEKLHKAIAGNPGQELFHFDVDVIGSDGTPTTDEHYIKQPFPKHLDSESFLRKRLTYQLNSFAVEYIVKRSTFVRQDGFVRYDLAWCSDDATWAKMAEQTGIMTIPGAKVHWRKSEVNITPNRSWSIGWRKLKSTIHHLHFCQKRVNGSFFIRLNYLLHAIYNCLR